MTRGSRTWAAAAIAAGCVFGAVATTRLAARRRPPAGVAAPDPPRAPELVLRDRSGHNAHRAGAAADGRAPEGAAPCGRLDDGRHGRRDHPLGGGRRRGRVDPALARPDRAARRCSLRRSRAACPQFRPVDRRRGAAAAPSDLALGAGAAAGRRPLAGPGARWSRGSGCTRPEHTVNIVLVTKTAMHRGRLWVRVRLPVLPNGRQGWVLRSALSGYTFVDTHLVVSLPPPPPDAVEGGPGHLPRAGRHRRPGHAHAARASSTSATA